MFENIQIKNYFERSWSAFTENHPEQLKNSVSAKAGQVSDQIIEQISRHEKDNEQYNFEILVYKWFTADNSIDMYNV